jgi:hypothetical protein
MLDRQFPRSLASDILFVPRQFGDNLDNSATKAGNAMVPLHHARQIMLDRSC